jgi:hypothetical protein
MFALLRTLYPIVRITPMAVGIRGILKRSDGSFEITAVVRQNGEFTLEASENLRDWFVVVTRHAGDQQITLDVESSSGSRRFFESQPHRKDRGVT